MKKVETTKLTENIRWSKDDLFESAKQEFDKWLQENSPTGEFSLIINVNQGGIRGKPKISRKEDL